MEITAKQIFQAFSEPGHPFMMIRPESKPGRWVDESKLDRLIDGGHAFAAMPRSNLIVVDFDEDRNIERGRWDSLLAAAKRGDHHFAWNSGRHGHAHVVIRADNPIAMSWFVQVLAHLKYNVRYGQYTRPPLSPHRLGAHVYLCDGFDMRDVGKTLSMPTKKFPYSAARLKKIETTMHEYRRRRPLPVKTRAQISNGVEVGRRSHAMLSVLCSMVLCGYSDAEIQEIFLDPSNRISEKILQMPIHRRLKELGYYIAKARKFVEQNPPDATKRTSRANLEHLRSAVALAIWTGRTGRTMRNVLLAHIAIAEAAGSLEYHASVRDLALRAEVTPFIASKRSRDLCELGWLVLKEKARNICANSWLLQVPANTATPSGKCHTSVLSVTPKQDLFRQRGLGRSAAVIVDHLQAAVATRKELVQRTGFGVATVKRHVQRLVRFGIAREDSRGSVSLSGAREAIMEDLLDRFSLRGTTARLREVFEEQRLHWRVFLGRRRRLPLRVRVVPAGEPAFA